MAYVSLDCASGQSGAGKLRTDIQDACVAIDRLRVEAPAHGLDLSRTVVVAHSAGGHLALWASARSALPTTSPSARPLAVRAPQSLAWLE